MSYLIDEFSNGYVDEDERQHWYEEGSPDLVASSSWSMIHVCELVQN
jgi:hypothetical protein